LIRTWLADTALDAFLAEHFQQQPLVRPNTAAAAVPLLGWETLQSLLESRPDVLVVRSGILHTGIEPPGFPEARHLFRSGYSLVIRGCEEHDAGLRGLAEAFGRELAGEIAVQVFATPAGASGFGWHYDCEDVFIVQTVGTKEYRLRANTVNPRPTLDSMPRDMQFERETSPVLACTLIPGDWLYVPRGFWHRAFATEDSLSISVGVLSAQARGGSTIRAWQKT
jgi:50S ribosomal protein L16 3-hydroxylase